MQITPNEAAEALGEIRQAQHKALRNAPPMFPAWYSVAVWGFVAGTQCVTEVLTGTAVWIGVGVLTAGLAAAVIVFLMQMRHRWPLRPHRSVVDPWAWVGFAGWVAGCVAVQFVLLFALLAAGFAYPRTGAALVAFVLVVLTAPVLPRWMTMRNARRAETR